MREAAAANGGIIPLALMAGMLESNGEGPGSAGDDKAQVQKVEQGADPTEQPPMQEVKKDDDSGAADGAAAVSDNPNGQGKDEDILQCTRSRTPPHCIYETVNPKAVTSNELYGYVQLDGEIKDGVISNIMRCMSKCKPPYKPQHTSKWLVLDGDIDPLWIESMNTAMDDNRVLTLSL